MEIKKVRVYAYEWICKECGRRFVALSERQVKAWARSHMLKHERK